jgi:hypothetical protein
MNGTEPCRSRGARGLRLSNKPALGTGNRPAHTWNRVEWPQDRCGHSTRVW